LPNTGFNVLAGLLAGLLLLGAGAALRRARPR
ncbi:MAG: LPXTG cell wall anchor domain-containing protein, partial [Solirubrobacteraceae bacterium]